MQQQQTEAIVACQVWIYPWILQNQLLSIGCYIYDPSALSEIGIELAMPGQ